MRFLLPAAIVAALLLSAAAREAPRPDPALTPQAVVAAQLAALRRAGAGDETAYAVVFRFASPRNQAFTGPLPRFVSMLKSGYGVLLQHRRVRQYFPVALEGDTATQRVSVELADGRTRDYLFLLQRNARAACRGCWLTDAVVEVPADSPEGLPGGHVL